MLASSLIARFIVSAASPSGRFLALYAATYAPGIAISALPDNQPNPPSIGHARRMAATLIEWASRLDSAGIQVHQEGAIARYLGGLEAPVFGRDPGPVAGRTKTVQFYADVLRASVDALRSRTYLIPAASWQGASVALTEASASASAFHAARAAMDAPTQEWPSDRPELAHLATQAPTVDRAALERDASRAAAMHTTAMAEAIGCLRVAEAGPWLRLVKDLADLPTGCLVVGVEVWAGHPIRGSLPANLDPQHGGGTFGLGVQPTGEGLAACTAAMQVVGALGGPLPATTRYVTPRMDPDALVAAMILSGRLPAEVAGSSQHMLELARLDDGAYTGGEWEWEPSSTIEPQTVGDSSTWGPVGALCLWFTQGTPRKIDGVDVPPPTLTDLEAAVFGALGAPASQRLRVAQAKHAAEWAASQAGAHRVTVSGPIALGVDLPFGAGTWGAVYSRAPIGVLMSESAPFGERGSGIRGRKFTVACHRAVSQGAAFQAAFRRLVAPLEPGWGGQATISGSPMIGPSKLDAATVVRLAQQAAAEVGVVGAGAVGHVTPTALR